MAADLGGQHLPRVATRCRLPVGLGLCHNPPLATQSEQPPRAIPHRDLVGVVHPLCERGEEGIVRVVIRGEKEGLVSLLLALADRLIGCRAVNAKLVEYDAERFRALVRHLRLRLSTQAFFSGLPANVTHTIVMSFDNRPFEDSYLLAQSVCFPYETLVLIKGDYELLRADLRLARQCLGPQSLP
jgi:hypothetical protein